MPAYKLSYFPIKGIAEVSRLLFVLAGESFEDDRVPFDQWPVVKPNCPFLQLPLLTVDGRPIPQSFAIARYLATKFGFAGKTPFEAAWVDALADQWKDYFNDIKPFLSVANGFLKGDKDVEEGCGRASEGQALQPAGEGGAANGFFVGSSLTWVDLLVADHITVFEQHVPGFFDAFPAVRKIQKTVQNDERLREYLEKRGETYF